MKIAIIANGNGWEQQADSRFGRARGFFVVDTENDETSYIDNEVNLRADHGAGPSAAKSVIDAGVEVVISAEVGPKAAIALKAGGVKVMTGIGEVSLKEAYTLYKDGRLKEQIL